MKPDSTASWQMMRFSLDAIQGQFVLMLLAFSADL